jgi:hypothetical protein
VVRSGFASFTCVDPDCNAFSGKHPGNRSRVVSHDTQRPDGECVLSVPSSPCAAPNALMSSLIPFRKRRKELNHKDTKTQRRNEKKKAKGD